MLFNSFAFAVFFILVTSLYFIIPYKYRWLLLLAASCYFYMAFIPYYILILGGTIVIDYFAGILIEGAPRGAKRKLFLVMSLVANIGVLAVFKYYNFFMDNINSMSGASLPLLSIILPIGLSFHTFQAMSYTIEVYRGNFRAERHFGIYALYVMFYPQLVAGPIERPQNILPQLRKKNDLDYTRIAAGLKQMLWGFFKKIVIADRLAVVVNSVYDSPGKFDGGSVLIATYFFAFQIYCDFSGYSDIAIGAAKVMGYDLMENFRTPYVSRSIREFWERWHISLSTWFRDYLYIPLGGNRVVKWRWYYNLFIVFIVSGFWHGANWTFIVWGALHGFYLVVSILLGRKERKENDFSAKVVRCGRILLTFHLVVFAWIFFRAKNMTEAMLIIKKLGNFFVSAGNHLKLLDAVKPAMLLVTLFLLLLFLFIDPFFDALVKERKQPGSRLLNLGVYSLLLVVILLFGYFGKTDFIYFQF
ncbi:MAG: MBOAT family O-acyltransferase [Bacteroidia bacterium]